MSPAEYIQHLEYRRLVGNIIEALTRRGEDFSDGECLDEVWALLTDAGYGAELERSLEANQ